MKHTSKRAFRTNVKARIKNLEVSRHAASVANGERPGWLTDMLSANRTPKGVQLDIKDRVANALGVDPNEIDRPGADMSVKTFPAPDWVAGVLQAIHDAKMKAVNVRVKVVAERVAARDGEAPKT